MSEKIEASSEMTPNDTFIPAGKTVSDSEAAGSYEHVEMDGDIDEGEYEEDDDGDEEIDEHEQDEEEQEEEEEEEQDEEGDAEDIDAPMPHDVPDAYIDVNAEVQLPVQQEDSQRQEVGEGGVAHTDTSELPSAQPGNAAVRGTLEQVNEASTSATQPADSVSSGAAGAAADYKQIEAQAAKVAMDVGNAAMEMSNKLTASFKSALGGLGASEQPSLSKLAGGLANWWSSLDPPSQPKRDETAEQVQASSKATAELQELFGLLPDENLVETFKCKLLQTYGCNHNSFTPAIQMAFQGTLYITDKHTCFTVEERNRKLPFKVLHTDITKAVRQRPMRKGDLSDLLRLDLSSSSPDLPQFLAFKDFDSGSALDSALALVEHLMEGP